MFSHKLLAFALPFYPLSFINFLFNFLIKSSSYRFLGKDVHFKCHMSEERFLVLVVKKSSKRLYKMSEKKKTNQNLESFVIF